MKQDVRTAQSSCRSTREGREIPCTVVSVGKVVPIGTASHRGRVIRIVPKRTQSGSLEKMIGAKGVRALRWFARPTLVQLPKPTR